jgi:biopolymer transport protein ExbD
MKRHYITAALTVIAVALIAFRLTHPKQRPTPRGMQTALVHDCTNEEAWRTLGDDRQIIVTSHADGSLSINQTPFTSSTVGPELATIFEYRSLKLVWYIADPHLTYGQAITNLSDLHADTSKFVIVMPTTNQVAAANSAFPHGESQCPYGF